MITVEDIQIKVYQLLKEKLKAVKLTGSVGYTRHDFTKEDVIILSKGSEGSSDLCVGSIVVNIHVPDIKSKKKDGSTNVRPPPPQLSASGHRPAAKERRLLWRGRGASQQRHPRLPAG